MLLDKAMCDMAAALNPHSNHFITGWNCTGGIPSPAVICKWGRVSCNSDLSVTGISLSLSDLKGTLPGSIGDIKSLQGLYLDYNQFTGVIPTSIGGLTALNTLDLKVNKFTGSFPQTLCGLSLQHIVLSGSGLKCYPVCILGIPDLIAYGLSACTSAPSGDIKRLYAVNLNSSF